MTPTDQSTEAANASLASRLSMGDVDLTDNWAARSYQIALRLYERGVWPTYLTAAELPYLAKALESQELWTQFISPRTEQWQITVPPPIFDIANEERRASKHSDDTDSAPDTTQVPPTRNAAGAAESAINKRSAPEDSDGSEQLMNGEGDVLGKAEKRAKTTAANSMDSDDEMLSVLSGSDIDMAMWTGDASVASNAMSPESTAEAAPALNKHFAGVPPTRDYAAAESSMVCAIAAFHARSAIFEQYLSVLCGTGECSMCTDTADVHADLDAIESQLSGPKSEKGLAGSSNASGSGDEEMAAEVPSLTDQQAPAALVSRSLDEDEDYDDDDGEEDESSAHNAISLSTAAPAAPAAPAANGSTNLGKQAQDSDSGTDTKPKQADSDSKPAVEPDGTASQAAGGKPSTFSFDLSADAQIATRAVFHTLDDLAEAVSEQSRHESNLRAVKEVVEQRAAEPKDMLVNQIGSLYHMKNLAQFIDNHRDSVSMTTRELTHLLSEVRPKRSKWASDRRVGQEQLYNALEHVLHELKAMGPVATPFLTQVKRRDAPDYYEVIRRPMDLATMSKKLRGLQYNSKDEFAVDIQLIRDNCYAYNTEPGNIYRKNVDALVKKARHLMESVPSVVVRDKSGGDAGGAGEDANTEFGDESGDESQGTRTIYGQREGSVLVDDGTPAPGASDGHPSNSQPMARMSAEDSATSISGAALDTAVSFCEESQQQQQQQQCLTVLAQNISRIMSNGTPLRTAIAEITDGYEPALGEKVWRSRVRKQLAEFSRRLEYDAHSELSERHAPQRTAEKMREFQNHTHDVLEHVRGQDIQAIERHADIADLLTVCPQASGSSGAVVARRRNEVLDEKRKDWLQNASELDANAWGFAGECEAATGLPQIETLESQIRKDGVVQWLNDDCESTVAELLSATLRHDADPGGGEGNASSSSSLLAHSCGIAGEEKQQPSLEAYAVARFPDNHMWRGMADNIERLRGIREVDSKIWATKLNIPVGYLHPGASSGGGSGVGDGSGKGKAAGDADEAGTIPVRDLHGDYASRPDPNAPFKVDAAGARMLLQRTSALILAHTGFEAITASAMSCLSDFLVDYMSNLGRTLRTYSDKYSKKMSAEAILAHSLYANGTEDLAELEYYMRGEVGKYAGKLIDLHKKLKRSYQDIVSDGRPDAATADASALESEGAFMTGMIGGVGDLGDDFFGFKELGLDKELGLEQLTVPQRLWYGKNAAHSEDGANAAHQETLAHPMPKPWAPIVTPQGQIGLMRSFICEKLKAKNGVDPPGHEHTAGGGDEEPEQKMPEQWEPIPEDEDLPTKARYGASRPKAPQPNYLTHPRTHMHVGSGKPVVAPGGRSAKKKPGKTTGSKTATKKK